MHFSEECFSFVEKTHLHTMSWISSCTGNTAHRIMGWKRPLEIVKSTPSVQSGSATAGCSGACPVVLWVSPLMGTPRTLRVTCSSAGPPTYWKRNILKQNFPYFNLCSTEKSQALSPVLSAARYWYKLARYPLSPLFSRLNCLSSICLSPYTRFSCPLTMSVSLQWTLSSAGSPDLGTDSGCVSPVLSRG